jgi:hypothetical protein
MEIYSVIATELRFNLTISSENMSSETKCDDFENQKLRIINGVVSKIPNNKKSIF